MDNRLEQVMARIQRTWGADAIQPAQTWQPAVAARSTGFAALDALTGGLPALTELTGTPTSGTSTLSYFTLAAAQAAEEHALVVSMTGAFDGGAAARAGVDLEALVLVEETDEILLLDLLRAIVRSRAVGTLVVDMLTATTRRWDLRRLLPDLWASGCSLVLLMPPHVRTDAADLRLRVQREAWLCVERDVVGCLSRVVVERDRHGTPGREARLLIPLDGEAWA